MWLYVPGLASCRSAPGEEGSTSASAWPSGVALFAPVEYRSPEVAAWWRAHEAADRAREERECASRELALKLARQVRDEAQAKIDELEREARGR